MKPVPDLRRVITVTFCPWCARLPILRSPGRFRVGPGASDNLI